MRVAVFCNDVVPGMGLPCSGQGVRASTAARMFREHGVEADVLIRDTTVSGRLERWPDEMRLMRPAGVRFYRARDLPEFLDGYDLAVVHNWAASEPLIATETAIPVVYDFFSATLVEHSYLTGDPDRLEHIGRVKRAAVARADLFWANGTGRADYARDFVRDEASEGRGDADRAVLDAPMAPEWSPGTGGRPTVTIGGFDQAWAAAPGEELVEAVAGAAPDHEIILLGGGERHNVQGSRRETAGAGEGRSGERVVRRLGPLDYDVYASIIGRSSAFIDVSPLNRERLISFSSRCVGAIALGCPVVHNAETDLGAMIERHDAGVAMPTDEGPIDPDDLAAAVRQCLSNDRDRPPREGCRSLHAELEAKAGEAVRITMDMVRDRQAAR